MDTIRRYSMFIGGHWVDADDRFEIRSPATDNQRALDVAYQLLLSTSGD